MSENAEVAVLGTGIMGAAMARNLLAAGMEVRVWNRTREKADPLARDGAAVAASPAEATEEAEFWSPCSRIRRRRGRRRERRACGARQRRCVAPDEYDRD
jgi:3-hydroxyacyl-CoA dehydrogenase